MTGGNELGEGWMFTAPVGTPMDSDRWVPIGRTTGPIAVTFDNTEVVTRFAGGTRVTYPASGTVTFTTEWTMSPEAVAALTGTRPGEPPPPTRYMIDFQGVVTAQRARGNNAWFAQVRRNTMLWHRALAHVRGRYLDLERSHGLRRGRTPLRAGYHARNRRRRLR